MNGNTDLIDQLLGLSPQHPLHALRHQREKVARATQGCQDTLFDPALSGLTLAERLLMACHAARLLDAAPARALFDHYHQQLLQAGGGMAASSPRLAAMLQFTHTLMQRPIEGDAAALRSLQAGAGLPTAAVVTLAQLIGFLSFQLRLVQGLAAMQEAMEDPAARVPASARPGAQLPDTRPGDIIQAQGFTNQTLVWHAWLDTVDVTRATPEQIAVLEESHPQAKVSDFYLFLIHQPDILRQRSAAFNAIMYAPGGLARAERELGATVVSRLNGCVYCASVHAQRFEQLARRNEVIGQVFDNPHTAGTTARERAIVDFSIQLTQHPASVDAASIHALQAAGLSPGEILDLLHSDAIFAWANRLMLNLGEPQE